MRILWHSVAPWVHSGYGQQTRIWAPRLAALGHDVAIATIFGLGGHATVWDGIPVLPSGSDPWGMDVLAGHVKHWKADLVITLADQWVMPPDVLQDCGAPVACWMPVDCDPLGVADESVIKGSGAQPIAISRHGEKMLRGAGLDPLYVPHGIETGVFKPTTGRHDGGPFLVGINAFNADQTRKSFAEMFLGFAAFHAKHPDSRLLVNSAVNNVVGDGLHLGPLAGRCGLLDVVDFAEQYGYRTGLFGNEAMAEWYGALDVLLNCSRGEGFGLPIIEAQACGTPVIVTDASAMPELCGAGWRVEGQRCWQPAHQAWWVTPSVAGITRALEKAFTLAGRKRQQAREFALAYDADRILTQYWVPALEALCG